MRKESSQENWMKLGHWSVKFDCCQEYIDHDFLIEVKHNDFQLLLYDDLEIDN